MKVVILRQHTDIINDYNPDIKFKPAPFPWSDRFCAFTVQRPAFNKMYDYLRQRGQNPYSLLVW